tara:strand:- start:1255 stop:2403 length:1149 start_codon:yes stop_codon:yes gene_type:complete
VNFSKVNSERFSQAQRIVLKIGSALVINEDTGAIKRQWLEALCADISSLHKQGKKVVLVSSGAIALGIRQLGINPVRARLEESQAAAAIGQIQLAHAYQEILGAYGIAAAQILLTLDDSESRKRYLNAASTLSTLLNNNSVPVVNENDTVATQEIRYGDNDRLAARVAQMVSADCLVLLSDVDGLYTTDPALSSDSDHIAEVNELTDEHLEMAGGPRSRHACGGMHTKLDAARIAMSAGCQMLITSGHLEHPIKACQEGARGTWFLPNTNPQASRKQWIAGTLKPKGSVTVDDGAKAALIEGKSLLPAGVTEVSGDFERGDAVSIKDKIGNELGRGLIAYPSNEALSIVGLHSDEIINNLGYRGRDELIHRDDLALINDGSE